MPQTVRIPVPSVADLSRALKAAKVLGATSVKISGGDTWIEVKRNGEHGELCFGCGEIIRPLRGGKRVLSKIDGETIIIEPWADASQSSKPYVTLELTWDGRP